MMKRESRQLPTLPFIVSSSAVQRDVMKTRRSILLHAAVVAAAAAATIPGRGEASLAPPAVKRVRWISVPHQPTAPAVPTPPARRADMLPPGTWVVVPPTAVLDHLPPIEVGGPVMPEEQIHIGGPGGTVGPTITGSPIGGPIEGIRDVGSVDKVPSVLGNPAVPRY